MADLFNTPGIHQEAESLTSLIAKCKPIVEAMAHGERVNLERAVQLGRLLSRLKDRCGHGQWGESLNAVGVTDTRARVYMLISKVPGLSGCASIAEAEHAARHHEVFEQVEQAASKLCRPCRIGTPKPNCPQCREMNEIPSKPGDEYGMAGKGHDAPSSPQEAVKPPKQPHQEPEREPGDEPPNELVDWFLRVAKAFERKIALVSQTLAVKPVDLQAIRETFTGLGERWHRIATAEPKAYAKPYAKKCKECGVELLMIQSTKYNWLALEKANGGVPRFWQDGDHAVCGRGGEYRLHGDYCTPVKE